MTDIKTVPPNRSDIVDAAICELKSAFIDVTLHAQTAFKLVAYIESLEAAVLAASAPTQEKPKPPKWYAREEMVMLLRHMNYCEVIAQELADWMVRHLQFAFNKGFQVRGWGEYTGCKPTSPVDAQDAVDAKRYRWLTETIGMRYSPPGGMAIKDLAEMNAAIDSEIAALQASQSPQDQVKT